MLTLTQAHVCAHHAHIHTLMGTVTGPGPPLSNLAQCRGPTSPGLSCAFPRGGPSLPAPLCLLRRGRLPPALVDSQPPCQYWPPRTAWRQLITHSPDPAVPSRTSEASASRWTSCPRPSGTPEVTHGGGGVWGNPRSGHMLHPLAQARNPAAPAPMFPHLPLPPLRPVSREPCLHQPSPRP